MGGIIFQLMVIVLLVSLLVYVALDDRKNRALREQEDAEERQQSEMNQ